VKDTIWAVGNKITIIDSKHNIEEIGGVVTSIQLKLELIENNVWIVSDKHIEIWDPETKQLINKIDDLIEGKISNISKIENNVWICGEVGTQGIIWIINAKTFELVKKLSAHKGNVYHVAKVGDLAWSVAWDQKIIAWDMNFNKVRTIPHLHRDSISYIHVFHLKKSKGWRVWTGSLDRTIDVTHVPAEYENILKDLEDSIEEEIEIPIRESKKERKDELPKIQVPKQVSIPEEKEPLENIEIPSKSGRKNKRKKR